MKKKKRNYSNKKKRKILKKKVAKSKSSNKKKIINKKSVKKVSKRKNRLKSDLIKSSKIKKDKKIKTIIKSSKIKKEPIDKFEKLIKGIITKLIGKYKVDGLYTTKIVAKGIPKKYRISENISKVETLLKNHGISILSEEEINEKKSEAGENADLTKELGKDQKIQTGKTDDPVRLYLRDMGSVELLSREGEIAIAKRIESGKEKMIGAICESPMTIRSIINWKESIKEGTMLLRDIADLDATYDMTEIADIKIGNTLKIIEDSAKKNEKKLKEKKLNKIETEKTNENNEEADEEDKDEIVEDSLNVSLAAMEEKLKPKVLRDFDEITKKFKKLHKYNQELLNLDKKNE